MAHRVTLVIRMDYETKRRIEEAADMQGLTITTFVVRAAYRTAKSVRKTYRAEDRGAVHTYSLRGTSTPRPEHFEAICKEAARGGEVGYAWVGRKLMCYATALFAQETSKDAEENYSSLISRVGSRDDAGVLGWFDQKLPSHMALVPRRRRQQLLKGIYEQAVHDEETLAR
jgi:hypothetical protein